MYHRNAKFIVAVISCIVLVFSMIPSQAYTEEQKQAVKAWLSAHGYSPDWSGVSQAYQDYLNGKFDGTEIDKKIKEYTGESTDESKDDTQESNDVEDDTDESSKNNSTDTLQRIFYFSNPSEEESSSDSSLHSEPVTIKDTIAEIALRDIIVDTEITPHIDNTMKRRYLCDNDMVYADMMFCITNKEIGDLNCEELLDISLQCDNGETYCGKKLYLENENGTDFKEDVILSAGKTGVLHYVIKVSKEIQRFHANIEFANQQYQILFNKMTRPNQYKRLCSEQSAEISNFGRLTVDTVVCASSLEVVNKERMAYLKIPLTICNDSGDSINAFSVVDGAIYRNGKITRGVLTVNGEVWATDTEKDADIENGQTLSAALLFPVKQKDLEKEFKIMVYFNNNTYTYIYQSDKCSNLTKIWQKCCIGYKNLERLY